MQKHLEQVLTAAGLPADKVKELVDTPDDKADFKTDDYVAPVHQTIETKVKNDPKFYEGINKENLPKEFLKTLESEQYGRAANIVRSNMLKAVGMKEEDFKELGDEGKKIEIFTPAFVKRLSDGKVTDKELQQKLIEANTKIQELEGNAPKLEEKYKGEYETKLNSEKIDFIVLAQLAQVQGLKAPAKYISDKIAAKLKSKYAFEINGAEAEIRQKDKPTLKVLTDNGTKELTLSGAIQAILAEDDLIEKKNSTTTTTGTTTVDVNKGGLKISSNVNDKINKRLKEDEKAGGGK